MEKFPQYSRTLIQSWILQGAYLLALTSLAGGFAFMIIQDCKLVRAKVSFDIVTQSVNDADVVHLGGEGKVIVDGRPAAKAGSSVKATSTIEIIAEVPKYVCR